MDSGLLLENKNVEEMNNDTGIKDKTYYQRKGVCLGICDTCLYAQLCVSGKTNKEMAELEKMRRFMQGFGIRI